jgi:hypothetical protein
VDSRRAPQWILVAHPLNKITQATINSRPPCPISRFPTPEHSETSPVPPQDGLRLNDLGRTKKAWPKLGHPYEQRAIATTQSKTRRCPSQSNVELMAEKQILGFKPEPRLEHVGDEHSERVQNRNHRSQ